MSLMEFTTENFDAEVLKSDIPVLIDFWAVWCGPCKMIAPYVEEIAKTYAGKFKVGKLNVDEQPQIAMNYGIRSIPTLLIFKNGKIADQIIGAVPKQMIVNKVDSQLQTA
jgi:thioredoxin